MGYQALLFCPDDKTARTVTQVLSELEFTVETCTEPFAAVKKLMGEHFDAVVVDCDNEQNATLLFKSARNSTSNQTSLAVAVVEGQAGVAKAFRIGANLVLTKPINIEQAKGTLRVARGLLRKSEPGKPGSPTATGTFTVPGAPTGASAAPAPAAPKPAAPKPAASVKSTAPSSLPPKPVAPSGTTSSKIAAQKTATTPAWPAAASAKTAPGAQDENLASAAKEKSAVPAPPVAPPSLYNAALATPVASRPSPPAPSPEIKPAASSASFSGAASAPAPAREPEAPKIEHKPAAASDDLFQKQAAPAQNESQAYVGSAPSFTFGGATAESESGGGNKKVFIGVAAALLLAVGAYFGWSHFKSSGGSSSPVASSAPVSTPAPVKPASAPPATTAPATSAPVSQPEVTLKSATPSEDEDESSAPPPSNSKPSASSVKSSSSAAPAKTAPAEKPASEEKTTEKTDTPALIVKGGKAPVAQAKTPAAPDAPPSMIGMAAPSAAEMPNLGTANPEFKPVLQTVSVSQGVSQGLLYKKVAPTYPQNALRMHVEGTVELMATISKTGDITHIKVLGGDAQLARAATEAVKQWKYKPYLLNGEPVEIQTQVTVNFKLPR